MSYLVAFDVLEDLSGPGCPICRAIERAGRDWVADLLREDVNNPTVRAALDRAGGLCAVHLRLAVEVADANGDDLGLALVLELLLSVGARAKHTREGRRRGRRRTAAVECPACAAELQRLRLYVEMIATSPPDSDIRRAADSPEAALCRAHLSASRRCLPQLDTSWLADRSLERGVQLRNRVSKRLADHATARGAAVGADPLWWHEPVAWLVGTTRAAPQR